MSEGMLQAASLHFHYEQCGEHSDTVFLHGFGGDLHTWDLLLKELGSSFSWLRYDMRGYGQSESGDGSEFSHADDLLAILDTLGIGSCNLVGVSQGGAVALNFALDHPERVRSLVLISPGMLAWEWSGQWVSLWKPLVGLAREGDLDKARELWWQHPLFETTRASAAAEELRASIKRFAGQQWIRDPQKKALPDVDRLHTLQARTLLLTGEKDMPDFRLIADLIENSCEDVHRVDFPGLGHLLQLEDPRGCAQAVAAFLSSQEMV